MLLDVRVPVQFGMCALSEAVNIPYSQLPDSLGRVDDLIAAASSTTASTLSDDAKATAKGVAQPTCCAVLCVRAVANTALRVCVM